ncbi:MAG: DMT family transporter [Coriobacteriales bacterium]|jgi:drug/metabolite transporter (DMT)-like permease|nr:DMT family transporter [Coriobacteriales bacterium]
MRAHELRNDRKSTLRSSAVLMLTALIWGGAFVGQRASMEFIGPFLFIALRMALGAASLLLVVLLGGALFPRRPEVQTNALRGRRFFLAGCVCGLVLFCSTAFQQVGIIDVQAGKAGFLTTLYIVLVPILGIALRHKTHWNTWLAVLIAVLGLYFLCVQPGFAIEPGDLIVLVGAFGWACHILVIDHFVRNASQRDVLRLCALQFVFAAVLALLCSLLFDGFFPRGSADLQAFLAALPSVLYVGILSTGLAFTLQAVGQQGLSPAAASLIMSLESVFAVLCGMLILHETMSLREVLGCAFMFAAVVISQLPRANRDTVAKPQKPGEPT